MEMTAIDNLWTDPANPRETIPEILEVIKESLRVFGFLLPVFVTENGKILSGNQRHKCAAALNLAEVPAAIPHISKKKSVTFQETCISILSNLIVSDGDVEHHVPHMTLDSASKLLEELKKLPDADDMYPVMSAQSIAVADLAEANPACSTGSTTARSGRVARRDYKIVLPVVATSELEILSGISRINGALYDGVQEWPVVICDTAPDLCRQVLNAAAMEFDFTAIKDVIRSAPWLNKIYTRRTLGLGMIQWSCPGGRIKTFRLEDPETKKNWIAEHGLYVADLGAGHLTESADHDLHGIKSVPFEPFVIPPGKWSPDWETSREFTQKFLREISRGRKFDSVFLSAVLNQVPFREDRVKLLTVAHALCDRSTTFYCKTLGYSLINTQKTRPIHGSTSFVIDGTEPGTVLTSIPSGRPLIQKFHTKEELEELVRPLWADAEITSKRSNVWAKGKSPRKVNPAALREAIEFEFDLPFWTGETLDLVDEALEAFSRRLRINL